MTSRYAPVKAHWHPTRCSGSVVQQTMMRPQSLHRGSAMPVFMVSCSLHTCNERGGTTCSPAFCARSGRAAANFARAAIVIFKRFYKRGLGHGSYLVGSEETGQARVLDVQRDVEDY